MTSIERDPPLADGIDGRFSEVAATLDAIEANMARAAAILAEQRRLLRRLQTLVDGGWAADGARNGNGNGDGNGNGNGRPTLTARQLEILRLLGEGLGTQQIAARLWISHATVRNHVHAILTALDCPTRLAAVAKARRLGLV